MTRVKTPPIRQRVVLPARPTAVRRAPVGCERARTLADLPGPPRLRRPRVQDEQHARKEEEQVADRVDGRPRPRRPPLVEHVGPDVPALEQGVGRRQHELGAVEHVAEVGRPFGRCVEGVAGGHLVRRGEGHRHDHPAAEPAGGGAQGVDGPDHPVHRAERRGRVEGRAHAVTSIRIVLLPGDRGRGRVARSRRSRARGRTGSERQAVFPLAEEVREPRA